MTSVTGSPPPSGSRARLAKAVLVTHGRPEIVGDGVARVVAVAERCGVELVLDADEARKHAVPSQGDPAGADLVVVLGGDGTMLRALTRQQGTGIPVLGVNFGRVGFLSAIGRDDLEDGLARVFAGELEEVELPTLEVERNGEIHVAVNDVFVTSSEVGRMVELEWGVGGEDLGVVACDGLICSTPSGSTAYNLSNGGPVLMWGLDALAVTFVAPHSLHARPLVVPRGRDVVAWNRTAGRDVAVLVDGYRVGEAHPDENVVVRLGSGRSLLGTLPEATFLSRYRRVFSA